MRHPYSNGPWVGAPLGEDLPSGQLRALYSGKSFYNWGDGPCRMSQGSTGGDEEGPFRHKRSGASYNLMTDAAPSKDLRLTAESVHYVASLGPRIMTAGP